MLKILNNEDIDRPIYTSMIYEIQTVMKFHHNTCITYIKRRQNATNHFLESYDRTNEIEQTYAIHM
jgi:hypothetical protein